MKQNKYIGFKLPSNLVDKEERIQKAEKYLVAWQGYAFIVAIDNREERINNSLLTSLV